MADSDYEKTVKLTPGGIPSAPGAGSSQPSQPPSGDLEKTVKINALPPQEKTSKLIPQDEKTVKLTPGSLVNQKLAASPNPLPILQPAQSAQMPELKASNKRIKIIGLFLALVFILLGAVWFFAPTWLKSQAQSVSAVGKHAEAAQRLSWALYLYPRDMGAYKFLYGQELRLSKNLPQAQKVFDELLAQKPDHYSALKELGLTYREAGTLQKALELFLKCAQQNAADMEVLQWSAELAYDLKDLPLAQKNLESLLKAGRGTLDHNYMLGSVFSEQGKFDESISVLKSALVKDSNYRAAHTLLTKIYQSQKNYTDAIAEAKLDYSLSGNNAELKTAIESLGMEGGNFFISNKDWKNALNAYQEGLAYTSPDMLAAYNYQLAVCFANLNNSGEALSYLGHAVVLDAALKLKARADKNFNRLKALKPFKKIVS